MLVKQCLKKGICGKVYKKGDDGFELSYCKLCGAPLEEKEVKEEVKQVAQKKINSNKNTHSVEKEVESKILVDKYGYIHFSETEQEEFLKGVKFIVYKDKLVHKVMKMESNKIIINRSMLEISEGKDGEGILIYNEKNEYFVQNLSEKKLYLNNDEIPHNESVKVIDGQRVVLDSNNWIEFKMN